MGKMFKSSPLKLHIQWDLNVNSTGMAHTVVTTVATIEGLYGKSANHEKWPPSAHVVL